MPICLEGARFSFEGPRTLNIGTKFDARCEPRCRARSHRIRRWLGCVVHIHMLFDWII